MPDDAYGDLDLSRVQPIWNLIDVVEGRLAPADRFHGANGPTLTARMFDEARPAGVRTYMTCKQLIATALDHHRALLNLISHGITPSAPWTLLRSTFEASVWVLWILESNDGHERCRRGLRRVCLDQKENNLWQDSMMTKTGPDLKIFMQPEPGRRKRIETRPISSVSVGKTPGRN